MRTRLTLLIMFCMTIPAYAVIVDRVAITAGNRVITESEIIRRIRLAAFQSGVAPDFSMASRREAAEHLIDQKLVEREMDLGHYERSSPELAGQLLIAFANEHFSKSTDALSLALAAIHLTPADFEIELAQQVDLLSFLYLRFRPAVQVSDTEVEKYFHDNIEGKTPTPVALADVRAKIEEILTEQKTDADLDAWLKDQRQRTRIVYQIAELK